eukprot:gene45572-56778_t
MNGSNLQKVTEDQLDEMDDTEIYDEDEGQIFEVEDDDDEDEDFKPGDDELENIIEVESGSEDYNLDDEDEEEYDADVEIEDTGYEIIDGERFVKEDILSELVAEASQFVQDDPHQLLPTLIIEVESNEYNLRHSSASPIVEEPVTVDDEEEEVVDMNKEEANDAIFHSVPSNDSENEPEVETQPQEAVPSDDITPIPGDVYVETTPVHEAERQTDEPSVPENDSLGAAADEAKKVEQPPPPPNTPVQKEEDLPSEGRLDNSGASVANESGQPTAVPAAVNETSEYQSAPP